MKRQNQLGGERNQELVVNKRTNLLWLERVFFSLLIKPQMGKSQPQLTCLFLLLSQMFDMMALSNEGVCE